MIRSLEVLLADLLAIPRRHRTLLPAIDGRGGSGKSSLARRLRDLAPATIGLVLRSTPTSWSTGAPAGTWTRSARWRSSTGGRFLGLTGRRGRIARW